MHACMQVLHCRSCSGMGASSVRFLAACYLCFNMDHNTVLLALASLPPVISPRHMPSGQSAHPSAQPPRAITPNMSSPVHDRGSITFIHGMISYVSFAGTGTCISCTAVAPAPNHKTVSARGSSTSIVQLQTCSISDLDVNLTECNCAAGMAPPSTPVGSSGKSQGGSFRGPFSGPAQERYGSYLGKVLTPSNVATSQALAPWK